MSSKNVLLATTVDMRSLRRVARADRRGFSSMYFLNADSGKPATAVPLPTVKVIFKSPKLSCPPSSLANSEFENKWMTSPAEYRRMRFQFSRPAEAIDAHTSPATTTKQTLSLQFNVLPSSNDHNEQKCRHSESGTNAPIKDSLRENYRIIMSLVSTDTSNLKKIKINTYSIAPSYLCPLLKQAPIFLSS